MANGTNNTLHADKESLRSYFILAYILTLVTGIAVLILGGESDWRLKLHAFQAIFLGIVMVVVGIVFGLIPFFGGIGIVINVLIWLFGIYVGLHAYKGNDIEIPLITYYARQYAGPPQRQHKK
jgi:uncharacterized membrane protein